ncbi:MAG: transcription antitermination factor NusB [Syntrophobacteraceae bacterium]|jgi:N utilization substance protein B|nr:transcription antitermination factor NusB [Syntrophobacteraceae bacterium]
MGRRRRSREIALQILYQMEMTHLPPEEAIDLYYQIFKEDDDLEFDIPMSVRPFAEDLVKGVDLHQSEIDRVIAAASEHWRIPRMSIVDRNILRIALFEMLFCPDIPPKVSINEAVDLGKTFGNPDSGAFINGILDHILADISSHDNQQEP